MMTIVTPVSGTCTWLFKHNQFRQWIRPQSSTLLCISGPPGCGKTVLSAFLVRTLQESQPLSTTVLYFFFDAKMESQNTVVSMLQGVLHQLLTIKPHLQTIADPHIRAKGAMAGNELLSLWEIFIACCTDSASGNIVLAIDALDECEEGGRAEFLSLLTDYYWRNYRKPNGDSIKVFMTTRLDFAVTEKLNGVPNIQLQLGSEGDSIHQDIILVIEERLHKALAGSGCTKKTYVDLKRRLFERAGNTFLWVSLVLDMIMKSAETSEESLHRLLDDLPEGLDNVYEKILQRTQPRHKEKLERILRIVTQSMRPLSLEELNIAQAIQESDASEADIRPRLELMMERTLQKLCGPFIKVVESKVFLIHQTAKEFLVCRARRTSEDLSLWRNSLDAPRSNLLLARICIDWLLSRRIVIESGNDRALSGVQISAPDGEGLLNYALTFWDTHARHASIASDPTLLMKVRSICRPDSEVFQACIHMRQQNLDQDKQPNDALCIASFFGLDSIVTELLGEDELGQGEQSHRKRDMVKTLIRRRQKDKAARPIGGAALAFAAGEGHESVCRLLLERGADPTSEKGIAVDYALRSRNVRIVDLLLKNGGRIFGNGQREMKMAADLGDEALLRLLLRNGVAIDTHLLDTSETALHIATRRGHTEFVRLLLQKGITLSVKTSVGLTALDLGAQMGRLAILTELLKHMSKSDIRLQTDFALFLAAPTGNVEVAEVLLDHGAQLTWRDDLGRTALHKAAEHGHDAVVELLLKHDAEIEDVDEMGETALMKAAKNGQIEVARTLLEREGDPLAMDYIKCSALSWAFLGGHQATVEILLDYIPMEDIQEGFNTLSSSWIWRFSHEGVKQVIRRRLNQQALKISMPTRSNQREQPAVYCYILLELLGITFKAMVAVGAQTTLIEAACTREVGLFPLIDTRYSGIARGVGTRPLLVRIHFAKLSISRKSFVTSLTVWDAPYQTVPIILGLDFLRRYQCVIDFEENVLVIGDSMVPLIYGSSA